MHKNRPLRQLIEENPHGLLELTPALSAIRASTARGKTIDEITQVLHGTIQRIVVTQAPPRLAKAAARTEFELWPAHRDYPYSISFPMRAELKQGDDVKVYIAAGEPLPAYQQPRTAPTLYLPRPLARAEEAYRVDRLDKDGTTVAYTLKNG